MKKGTTFDHDGEAYEALRDGVEHAKGKPGPCIRKGKAKYVTIQEALRGGLIRRVRESKADDLFSRPRKDSPLSGATESTTVERTLESVASAPYTRAQGDNTYYMPVDQLRAQVYLAHGLIYPSVYDKAGLASDFADAQALSPADLTLYKTPQPLKKDQLLLHVLLHPDEVADAARSPDVLRHSLPLPISRLVQIDIPAAVGDPQRFADGWVKPDVPVPRHIFRSAQTELRDTRAVTADPQRRNTKAIAGVEESIAKFDRYMGTMAFLRNAARYFSEKSGYYADYPDLYFALCAQVLRQPELVRPEGPPPNPLALALLDVDTTLSEPAKQILALVTSRDPYIEKEKARTLAMGVYKDAGESSALANAFKTLFSGDYRSAVKALQGADVPMEAAVLAALFKFSNRQSGDHRTVKQRLHDDWSSVERVCPVLAALGAYHGYTALDARETSLYSTHALVRPLIEERPAIKCHLATIFERQMVEALYRRAFFPKESPTTADALYDGVAVAESQPPPKPRLKLVKDSSYTVRDLFVARYEVARHEVGLIGKLVQRLLGWKGDTIDEQSEVGRCLMSQCFFYAEDYELSQKGGRQVLHYRIPKKRVIELITDEKIVINPRILNVAIEEDARENAQ